MYNAWDIPDSWKGLFGKRDPKFPIDTKDNAVVSDNPFRVDDDAIDKESIAVGKGVSLWHNRESNGGKLGSGWQFMPISINGLALWEPIIRPVGRKTIIETPMVERSGSVKEIISSDDWIFNIRGVIKRADGRYPDAEITQLVDLRNQQKALPIISALTTILLQHEFVVITSLTFPETPGRTQSVAYEIECVGDIPFKLELQAETKSSNSVTVGNLTGGQ